MPTLNLPDTTIITGLCRILYANDLWQPKMPPNAKEERDENGQLKIRLKYGCTLLVPKTDTTTVNGMLKCINAARLRGVTLGKWSKERAPHVKSVVRDGDAELEQGLKKDRVYAGHYFVNAATYSPPELVGPNPRIPLPKDRKHIYSGMFGCAEINFYPAKVNGNEVIAAGLNSLQKVKDGERVDGRVDPSSVYQSYDTDDGPEAPIGGGGAVSF